MSRFILPVETLDGVFNAHYSENGLSELDFPGRRKNVIFSSDPPQQVLKWHALTTEALVAALEGKPLSELPPLDLVGSNFQKDVWAVLQRLKVGETITYGEIAAKLGGVGAARAVGAACGANPIPVLIPCHRVLAAGGKLGGFSGGLPWKKKLLAIETEQAGLALLQPSVRK